MTSLFYAYAKRNANENEGRYLITFANRAWADEWWRAVSTSPDTAFSGTITRVTPQFYTHQPERANIANSIIRDNVAKKFANKVIFTLLDDRDGGRRFPIIPLGPDPITDYISNKWFYIRSKVDRSVYWYSTVKGDTYTDIHGHSQPADEGTIIASRSRSTRFNINTKDGGLDRKVMINSNVIHINLAGGELSIRVSDKGNLHASAKADDFVFGDFTDGFIINGNGTKQISRLSRNGIVKVNDHSGEAWELVMNGRVYDD
ncbi:hypothetical protein PQX77_006801 [Marasmius sp. AFHP31]|nr:hypothetical protein PQX77_006801 [Marasmius sp. AFHP31]